MQDIITFLWDICSASWGVLLEAAPYMLFGLLIGGILKVFLTPSSVARHLGRGRIKPVLKAALFGIPIPLCSCGVLPAAASLKKQGANNGATVAFLISTPESGVDSISISWALLDPIMTIVRPIAAFVSALVAGIIENFRHRPEQDAKIQIDQSCPVDNCCDGLDCLPEEHRKHHSKYEKMVQAIRFALGELWNDIAGPFFIGVVLAGIIYILVPEDFFSTYLGGGLHSMLIMLVLGIPLYICATASTPIAAAFILKGVSPGAALVFLLVGPATNIMSLSVLTSLLGKRAVGVYLASISFVSVLFGLSLDMMYVYLGMSAQATIGKATEILPGWFKVLSAVILLLLSIPIFLQYLRKITKRTEQSCGCSGSTCSVD